MKIIIIVLFFCVWFSCSNSSKVSSEQYNKSEILIDLEKNSNPSKLEQTFSKYNLTVDKIISSSLNIVLYHFNSDKITVEDLIVKVKKNEDVEAAQNNKVINNRR